MLTSGSADRPRANRFESLSASDESTLVGCIGHGWSILQCLEYIVPKTSLEVQMTRKRPKTFPDALIFEMVFSSRGGGGEIFNVALIWKANNVILI